MDKWKQLKRSGNFRRKVQNSINKMKESQLSILQYNKHQKLTPEITNNENNLIHGPVKKTTFNKVTFTETRHDIYREENLLQECHTSNNWMIELESNEDTTEVDESIKNSNVRLGLKVWANSFNINHCALKELFKIWNERIPNILPLDPRTLLRTARSVNIIKMSGGDYWHQGLKYCLQKYLTNINVNLVSLNINIDGLPIYNSSKQEFWPILCNIYEIPQIKPMVIGIYCGNGKPRNINDFLRPFVDEIKDILNNGVIVNDIKKIDVRIRCFICDSPARAFVKGVANFNSQHGCIKCTTIGEYSYISRCNYYPRHVFERRTDKLFREKKYELHHKSDTPLTELPIDMIEDFPVGDALHLIDLGLMKKCLMGWRDGSFGNYRAKWCARDVFQISEFLNKCKMPAEIHRKVRGLDCLAHWKGLEYRTFLYYIGIVILKDFLPQDIYEHFLIFFCAITICSSTVYSDMLNLAETFLQHYVEYYGDLYGEDYITSNVHNLNHLVDEVKKFGILSTFTAYPFESKLYQIKNLLRNGHSPLIQAAKRLGELTECEFQACTIDTSITYTYPIPKRKSSTEDFYLMVEMETYFLNLSSENKWFLTRNNEIIEMKHAILQNGIVYIYGCALDQIENVFEKPIKSCYLNIYASNCQKTLPKLYSVEEIKSKLVAIYYSETKTVFIPLLHTLL